MAFLILLVFMGAVYVTFSLWSCWLVWRRERIKREGLLIAHMIRRTKALPEKDFPAMTAYASKALPGIHEMLIEEIAKKHNRSPAVVIEGLLADTRTDSLDDALRSPISSLQSTDIPRTGLPPDSSVEDLLWAHLDATDDPLQLRIRGWIRGAKLSARWIAVLEYLLLTAAILFTAGIVAFLVISLTAGSFKGSLPRYGGRMKTIEGF